MFPHRATITDHQSRFFPTKLHVLRAMPKNREWVHGTSSTNLGPSLHHHMGKQYDAVPQFDVCADNAVGTDRDAIAKTRTIRNDCRGMNIRHRLIPDRKMSFIAGDHCGKI